MDITLPLDSMSIAEKLRAMEALWADLSRNEIALESPPRHEQVLREREESFKTGKENLSIGKQLNLIFAAAFHENLHSAVSHV